MLFDFDSWQFKYLIMSLPRLPRFPPYPRIAPPQPLNCATTRRAQLYLLRFRHSPSSGKVEQRLLSIGDSREEYRMDCRFSPGCRSSRMQCNFSYAFATSIAVISLLSPFAFCFAERYYAATIEADIFSERAPHARGPIMMSIPLFRDFDLPASLPLFRFAGSTYYLFIFSERDTRLLHARRILNRCLPRSLFTPIPIPARLAIPTPRQCARATILSPLAREDLLASFYLPSPPTHRATHR